MFSSDFQNGQTPSVVGRLLGVDQPRLAHCAMDFGCQRPEPSGYVLSTFFFKKGLILEKKMLQWKPCGSFHTRRSPSYPFGKFHSINPIKRFAQRPLKVCPT